MARRLPYDSLAALRQAIFKAVPHLMRVDQIEPGNAADLRTLAGNSQLRYKILQGVSILAGVGFGPGHTKKNCNQKRSSRT